MGRFLLITTTLLGLLAPPIGCSDDSGNRDASPDAVTDSGNPDRPAVDASSDAGEAGVCAAQGASCSGGQRCCAGLSCCSGVPVPAGGEFCGNTCPIR